MREGRCMMSEEMKERLLKAQYDHVGELMRDLITACPYLPPNLQGEDRGVLYQSIGADPCICILTQTGEKHFKENVQGGQTGQIKYQVAYKSQPATNEQHLNAQAALDSMMSWLEEIKTYPSLTKGRTITRITASASSAMAEEVNKIHGTVYAADVVLEYESE